MPITPTSPSVVDACCESTLDQRLHGRQETRVDPSEPTTEGLGVCCPDCGETVSIGCESELQAITCPACDGVFSLVNDARAGGFEPGDELAHFRLVDKVGVGAFGAVWRAEDTRLDRTVAIKIPRRGRLDAVQERAFLREAQNAGGLNHPGIVPVYEVGREGETLYLVSEFVEGVSLADRLSGSPLSIREAAALGQQIAGALGHAHDSGVVHRDLKPANIMLDSASATAAENGGEAPRIMDFGLARREDIDATMTAEGQLLGTPAYMSPEQAQGEGHLADASSDVYSLGVVLFELLTGELPFRGSKRMLLEQVANDDPPSPRKLNAAVPRDLETITLKCLEKAPQRRYRSAGEVADELRRWADSEPIRARPASAAYRMRRWCQRNAAAVAAAVCLFLVLASGLTATSVLWRQTDRALQQAEAAEQQSRAKTVELEQMAARLREQAGEFRQQALRLQAAHREIALLAGRLYEGSIPKANSPLAADSATQLAALSPESDPSSETAMAALSPSVTEQPDEEPTAQFRHATRADDDVKSRVAASATEALPREQPPASRSTTAAGNALTRGVATRSFGAGSEVTRSAATRSVATISPGFESRDWSQGAESRQVFPASSWVSHAATPLNTSRTVAARQELTAQQVDLLQAIERKASESAEASLPEVIGANKKTKRYLLPWKRRQAGQVRKR